MLYGLVVFISLTFVNCVMLFGFNICWNVPTDRARVTRGTNAVWRKTAAMDEKVNLLPVVPLFLSPQWWSSGTAFTPRNGGLRFNIEPRYKIRYYVE